MPNSSDQIILAVDTCSGQSSIALGTSSVGTGFALLGQVELAAEWTSTALHVEISRLLEQHQLTTAAIGGYAVTNGPGSFTAVRIGTAAVKGLAEVHGKRVASVSTLALIAQASEWSSIEGEAAADIVWLPILDARRAQVFSGLYRRQGGSLKLMEPETVSALRAVLERLSSLGKAQVRFCSPNIELFADTIAAADYPPAAIVKAPAALAGTLARMGSLAFARGDAVDPVAVDANYIRASDAELFWKA